MINLKRITFMAAGLMMAVLQLSAQDNGGVTRRSASDRRGQQQQQDGSQVTQRMQQFYETDGGSISDADRAWMRVIYRQLDLEKDKNAPLYFPEEPVDGQLNLFRVIMQLLADNKVSAYEYLDGREIFSDQYRINVRD
ncbi:MAG: gliding motility protein GldN, partial [Muribaculaceae bacterium]|nr:gliding motility protein GldN [Muribaculaceae bacterium]